MEVVCSESEGRTREATRSSTGAGWPDPIMPMESSKLPEIVSAENAPNCRNSAHKNTHTKCIVTLHIQIYIHLRYYRISSIPYHSARMLRCPGQAEMRPNAARMPQTNLNAKLACIFHRCWIVIMFLHGSWCHTVQTSDLMHKQYGIPIRYSYEGTYISAVRYRRTAYRVYTSTGTGYAHM